MLWFMKQHKIAVHGHNIPWDVAKYHPIGSNHSHIGSLNWLLKEEYDPQSGEDASALFLKYAYLWDPSTLMFMNEYNTIENSEDQASTPAKASPDTLAAAGLPFRLTEVDVKKAHKQCLEKPHKPQYGGGIIKNPELSHGLKGWSAFGNAKIEQRESGGNKFLVAHGRSQPYDSISQKVYLEENKFYTLSAWIQVSEGAAPVTAVFKTITGFKHAGAVVAESKCWSMLKGGLSPDASGLAELYFENHKTNVRIQAVDKQGKPLQNANISIEQKQLQFPFGCAINKNILTNTAYQNWFTSRFKVTAFEDEMKWYSTEASPGREDYSASDAMLQFAKNHNIAVRGHNIFWDDPQYQPGWVNSLSPSDLSKAADKRINSVTSRYKGQVIAWDVVNENLHFSFFESKLGQNASGVFFNRVHSLDGATTLFMNDYNTIEDSRDGKATPAMYLQKLRQISEFPGNQNLRIGIGLESHFSTPNIPYMRASIDTLGATGLPIWLTEVDVQSSPNQAQYLEQILREAHAHPKVQGIVVWAAWKPSGCYRMCLTDNNFKNLATGDVVDKLLHEWGSKRLEGKTDADGFFDTTLFHGDYEVKINRQAANTIFSMAQSFKVLPTNASQTISMLIKVSA
ncbi:GH10 domain-containing protein [Citrus sinensis]|nr:GH10 domain-containing protein [Citrus sinensis]